MTFCFVCTWDFTFSCLLATQLSFCGTTTCWGGYKSSVKVRFLQIIISAGAEPSRACSITLQLQRVFSTASEKDFPSPGDLHDHFKVLHSAIALRVVEWGQPTLYYLAVQAIFKLKKGELRSITSDNRPHWLGSLRYLTALWVKVMNNNHVPVGRRSFHKLIRNVSLKVFPWKDRPFDSFQWVLYWLDWFFTQCAASHSTTNMRGKTRMTIVSYAEHLEHGGTCESLCTFHGRCKSDRRWWTLIATGNKVWISLELCWATHSQCT